MNRDKEGVSGLTEVPSRIFETASDQRRQGEDAYPVLALGDLKKASTFQTSLSYIIQALSQNRKEGQNNTDFLAVGRMAGRVGGICSAGCPGVRTTSVL